MSICVAQTVQKGTVRDATARHDGNLVSVACHRAPLAAQPLATRAWEVPRATRWWMRWSVGTGWLLAAASALPRSSSCRARKLVAHQDLRCLGWSSRQAPLAGALSPCRDAWRVAASSLGCLGWPSRQVPLAGALSLHLKYFVLEWLQRNQRRTMAVARQALPRGVATARAQVRDTRVPLL